MRFFVAMLGLLALAGLAVGAVHYATPHGIGISPDSTKYIVTARNLAAGKGYVFAGVPLTHFPPMYPLMLAVGSFWKIDPTVMARWICAALLACDVMLAGLLVFACTGRAVLWSWMAGIGVLIATPMVHVHSYAWSEPAFIFFSLLCLAALARQTQRGGMGWLLVSAALAAAAFLTRYVGAALVISAMLSILLVGRGTIGRRMADSLLFFLVACLPMACWMVRNHHVAGTLSDREMAVHWIDQAKIKEGVGIVSQWLIPHAIERQRRTVVLFPAALILFLLASWGGWRCSSRPGTIRRLPAVMAIFVVMFLLFLCGTISLVDAATEMNERILSPIFLPALLAALCISHTPVCVALQALGMGGRRASRLADVPPPPSQTIAMVRLMIMLVALVLMLVSHGTRTYAWIERSRVGLGYASSEFRDSPIVRRAHELPSGVLIYTNGIDEISFLAGRDARQLPLKLNRTSRKANERYDVEMERMAEQMREGKAVIVYFTRLKRDYMPSDDELAKRFAIRPMAEESDGVMFTATERSATQSSSRP